MFFLTLCLLFIIRLRFPTGKSTTSEGCEGAMPHRNKKERGGKSHQRLKMCERTIKSCILGNINPLLPNVP